MKYIKIAFIFLFGVFQVQAQSGYDQVDVYLSDNVWGMVSGDVNGDNLKDLIFNNLCTSPGCSINTNENGTITVLTANGTGGFELAGIYTTGIVSFKSLINDMNDDGYPDIVVCNRGTSTVKGSMSLLINDGTGKFSTMYNYTINGASLVNFVINDLNQDQKPDLVVSGGRGNFIGVLTNTGIAPYFGIVKEYNLGSKVDIVGSADFNQDNMPDLITETDAAGIIILTNTGIGSFETAATFTVEGFNTGKFIIEDFNNDGKTDIAVAHGANFPNPGIDVLINQGNLQFKDSTYTAFTGGPGFNQPLEVLDFNGDGILDLATNDNLGSQATIVVITGTGTGTFSAPIPTLIRIFGYVTLLALDINNDNKEDFMVSYGGYTGRVLPGFIYRNRTVITITSPVIIKQFNQSPFAITATSNSSVDFDYAVISGTGIAISSITGIATITGAGTALIQIHQNSITGYSEAFDTITVIVNKVPLTITSLNQHKQTGNSNPTFTYSIAGFVTGDNETAFTQPVQIGTTATASSTVGMYPITIGGAMAANYTISYVQGTLTINPLPVPVISSVLCSTTPCAPGDLATASGTALGDVSSVCFPTSNGPVCVSPLTISTLSFTIQIPTSAIVGTVTLTGAFGIVTYEQALLTDLVTELEAVSSVKIYPNPSNGIFTIESKALIHITIINTTGQKVLEENISGKKDIILNANGIYVILSRSDKTFETRKVVVK